MDLKVDNMMFYPLTTKTTLLDHLSQKIISVDHDGGFFLNQGSPTNKDVIYTKEFIHPDLYNYLLKGIINSAPTCEQCSEKLMCKNWQTLCKFNDYYSLTESFNILISADFNCPLDFAAAFKTESSKMLQSVLKSLQPPSTPSSVSVGGRPRDLALRGGAITQTVVSVFGEEKILPVDPPKQESDKFNEFDELVKNYLEEPQNAKS